jgi:Gpi18-like mannosyltransferase
MQSLAKFADSFKKEMNIRVLGLILGVVLLALLLRRELLHVITPDFNCCLDPWTNFIRSHGRFSAFKYNFSDYNVPYLYLLSIGTFFTNSNLTLVKYISIFFDFILTLFVYLTVKVKYENKIYIPIAAGLITLLLPTIFLNSAAWGQSDVIYTSFDLGAVYFFLRKRYAWGFLFLGLSFSFKLQAIFLFPLVFVLVSNGEISFKSLKYIVLMPITYFVLLIPAMIAGRSLNDLLHIYLNQSLRPAGLTGLAPTIYAWFSLNAAGGNPYAHAMIVLACAIVLMVSFLVLISHKKISSAICINLSLLFVILLPFLLPAMHERYFYLADVFSLVYAFYRPKFFFVAIIVEVTSFLCYIPYLANDGEQIVPLSILSFFTLVSSSIVAFDLIKQLFIEDTLEEEKPLTLLQTTSDDAPTNPILVAEKDTVLH